MIKAKYFLLCLKAAIAQIHVNFEITLCTFIICLILGTGIALARVFKIPVLKPVLDVLMAFSKALPGNLILMMTFLLITSNLPNIINALHLKMTVKDLNLNIVAIIALSISGLPGVSEVIRGGLMAVGYNQFEAGYSMGLTGFQTFIHVIAPQTLTAIIAPLTNSVLGMFKGTALVSVIGVIDIMNGATNAASSSYCYLEAYLSAALVFWVLGFVLEKISSLTEKRLRQSVKTA